MSASLRRRASAREKTGGDRRSVRYRLAVFRDFLVTSAGSPARLYKRRCGRSPRRLPVTRILHSFFAFETLVEGFDDDFLDSGCGNSANRSALRRLGLSMQARSRRIVAITDAGLGRMRRRHGVSRGVRQPRRPHARTASLRHVSGQAFPRYHAQSVPVGAQQGPGPQQSDSRPASRQAEDGRLPVWTEEDIAKLEERWPRGNASASFMCFSRASRSCVAARALPPRCITAGRWSSWRPASAGWRETRPAPQRLAT